MRRIKFRSWDLDNLQMHYSDREEDNGEGPIIWSLTDDTIKFSENQMFDTCPGGMGHVQEFHYREPNQVLMQYTCKIDKAGSEIYEGDILKCVDIQDSNIDICQVNYEVKWDEKYACFDIPFDPWYWKVIGNIYEGLSKEE